MQIMCTTLQRILPMVLAEMRRCQSDFIWLLVILEAIYIYINFKGKLLGTTNWNFLGNLEAAILREDR
jgi:hypothetical protein